LKDKALKVIEVLEASDTNYMGVAEKAIRKYKINNQHEKTD